MSPVQRIVLWLLSTVSVLVLLFGYHTSTSGPVATASPPALITGSGQSASGGSGGENGGSSGSSSGGSAKKSGGGQSQPQAAQAATYTGGVAQTQWGPVQVAIVVSGGRITDVGVPQYPNGNGQDQAINSYALPILVQETFQQQSANIDMVSGATVTSTGYLQSLQSALDQAGM